MNFVVSGTFVFVFNTFGGPILASLFHTKHHFAIIAATMTTSLVFAGWFMRHSQSWRVWGPKFVFSTGGFVFVSLSLFIQSFLIK
jgi:hypothetical protein